MAVTKFPRINGKFCDYADITIFVNGRPFIGVKEINYKQSREQGMVRGTSPFVLGRTRGQYDAEGSFTMYQEDAVAFRTALGPGYLEKEFNIVVSYTPRGGLLVTDSLNGCILTEDDVSRSEGTDPVEDKFSFHILQVLKNGIPAMLP